MREGLWTEAGYVYVSFAFLSPPPFFNALWSEFLELLRIENWVTDGSILFCRLGTLFNAAYGVSRQEHLERWIQAKFPTQWVELKRLGARKMDDGPRLFNIDRRLTP